MTNNVQTKSQIEAANVSALLRARNSLLQVVTREEGRAERYLFEAAAAAGYVARNWDCAAGVTDIAGKSQPIAGPDAMEILTEIAKRSLEGTERGVWILRDFAAWLDGPANTQTLRALRNLARSLPGTPRERAQAIVLLGPKSSLPDEIAAHATMINWPMPDRAEIAAILDASIDALPDEMKETAAPNGTRNAAIDAAVGLTGDEAQACYSKSLVQLRRIDPVAVSSEKKRIIAKEKVLEWHDPIPGGLDAVGGLDNLKAWLRERSSAYSAEARAYGLRSPRGALLVGVPGCGKSLTAKAIATAWQCPLLRADLGALKNSFVGKSEENIRKMFSVIDAIGRCVVWFDEIEKAISSGGGVSDGGVSSDALGAILNWMQERGGDAFVIATANDATILPPELMRKGRFDEVWSIDLPTKVERVAILSAALKSNGRPVDCISENEKTNIAEACKDFTGSEIAALVPDAMFAAFNDGARQITAADLARAVSSVTPLATTAAEKIASLRAWAKTRARPATQPDAIATGDNVRRLDLA